MKRLIRTITLLWSLILTKGDEAVTCLFSQDCVLPCQSDYKEVIHWQKVVGNRIAIIHSFYSGSDQLELQDEAYKNRTSLFPDQISNGNTSLILRGVRIQDMGRYKCYTAVTSANKEADINVNVKAPIKSVDLKITNDGITCNTSEVYPEPRISWTTVGTSQDKDLKHGNPETKQDSQGLYSLVSTLSAQPVQDSLTYTCTISSEDRTQTYTASLTHKKTEIYSGQDITVFCPEPQGDAGNFTLTLTFKGSSIVLSYDSQASQQDIKWNDIDVKITREGNVTLHKLDCEKHSGTYTCERITTQSRQIMQTSVQIKSSKAGIVAVTVVAVIAVVAVAICLMTKRLCKAKTMD
ncbi:hypothetical protein NFI96_033244 [Prochilodus magdalenae]|nr:hypothetical protein NFI96_033244 [Prochilodus magdalenae]